MILGHFKTLNAKIYFNMDVFVSETLPVHNFIINELLYDGELKHVSGNQELLNVIVLIIRNKLIYRVENFYPKKNNFDCVDKLTSRG